MPGFAFIDPAMNETTTTTRFEGDVNENAFRAISPKLSRISRAAAKLGTKFELTVGEAFGKRVGNDSLGNPAFRSFVHVVIEAEVPVISGWKFAAAIDHSGDGNLIRMSPNFAGSLPVSFRHDKSTCDHCNKERNRLTTFALTRTAEGGAHQEFKRVGSACLVDFLGHGNAVSLMEWAATLADTCAALGAAGGDDDCDEPMGYGKEWFGVRNLVGMAFEAVAENKGAFITRKQADEAVACGNHIESTRERVLRALFPNRMHPEEDRLPALNSDEQAKVDGLTSAALEWAAGLPTDGSEFDWNLHLMANRECTDRKGLGLAVYICGGYLRHLSLAAERASSPVSNYVGTPGSKVIITFTPSAIHSSEGFYGTTYWVKGTDEAGNRVTVKSSTGAPRNAGDYEVGTAVKIEAKVEKHEEFKGSKSTLLGRATLARERKEPKSKKARKTD